MNKKEDLTDNMTFQVNVKWASETFRRPSGSGMVPTVVLKETALESTTASGQTTALV